MLILDIIVCIIGAYIFVYSLFEVKTWWCLYFARDYYCIERLRKNTKTTDAVSCVHSAAMMGLGVVLVLTGLRRWIPADNYHLTHSILIICFCLLVIDAVVLEGITRTRGLKTIRNETEKKWKSEKVFCKEHDHEVNLYRGVVRVTQSYPRHIIAASVSFGIILLLHLS